MRHVKKGYKLGRTASHRKATLAALSVALIQHKQITTTLTKAKALRSYVEPLITRARVDTTQNRREVFRHLMDKYAVTELFGEIYEKVGERPGGYTRVLRIGQRSGDSAEMAIIELVDFNESVPEDQRARRRRTRRGRRRRSPDSPPVESINTSAKPRVEEDNDIRVDDLPEPDEAAKDLTESDSLNTEPSDSEDITPSPVEDEHKSEEAAPESGESEIDKKESSS